MTREFLAGDRTPANQQEVYAIEQMALAARPRRRVRVQAMDGTGREARIPVI